LAKRFVRTVGDSIELTDERKVRFVRRRIVRHEREDVERRRQRQHAEPDCDEYLEIRAAREQVGVLQIAVSALAEADREQGVIQLERAACTYLGTCDGRVLGGIGETGTSVSNAPPQTG